MKNNRIVTYSYKSKGPTKIWTTLPLLAHNHPNVVIQKVSHTPIESFTDQGGNIIYYLELRENEQFILEYLIDITPQQDNRPLSTEEREYYLRSGSFIPITTEIRSLAEDITETATTEYEKAHLLFEYIVKNYEYFYQPKIKGVISFLKTKQGDSAEYSYLFTALCRSIGIPCRTVIGSWGISKMQGHVWNEVYLENHGWLPVDCSMAYLQKYKKLHNLYSSIRTLSWKKYFGQIESQRVIFSKDAEILLYPAYKDHENPSEVSSFTMNFNWQPFYWGYESMNGATPYIQPIYVQYDYNQKSKNNKLKAKDYLGTWKVKELGFDRFLYLLKMLSLVTVMITTILGLFIKQFEILAIGTIALLTIGISFVLRKERVIFFTIFSIFWTVLLVIVIAWVNRV